MPRTTRHPISKDNQTHTRISHLRTNRHSLSTILLQIDPINLHTTRLHHLLKMKPRPWTGRLHGNLFLQRQYTASRNLPASSHLHFMVVFLKPPKVKPTSFAIQPSQHSRKRPRHKNRTFSNAHTGNWIGMMSRSWGVILNQLARQPIGLKSLLLNSLLQNSFQALVSSKTPALNPFSLKPSP